MITLSLSDSDTRDVNKTKSVGEDFIVAHVLDNGIKIGKTVLCQYHDSATDSFESGVGLTVTKSHQDRFRDILKSVIHLWTSAGFDVDYVV